VSTVLLVDDDAVVRKILSAVLEQAGFSVLTAADGRSAIDAAKAHRGPLEVLVSDIQMPDLSGLEVAAALAESRPGLKVLLLSSAEAPADLCEGWSFLQKPFPPTALIDKLAQIRVIGTGRAT